STTISKTLGRAAGAQLASTQRQRRSRFIVETSLSRPSERTTGDSRLTFALPGIRSGDRVPPTPTPSSVGRNVRRATCGSRDRLRTDRRQLFFCRRLLGPVSHRERSAVALPARARGWPSLLRAERHVLRFVPTLRRQTAVLLRRRVAHPPLKRLPPLPAHQARRGQSTACLLRGVVVGCVANQRGCARLVCRLRASARHDARGRGRVAPCPERSSGVAGRLEDP